MFNTLSFTSEIFRVLISAEVQRSFMSRSKDLVELVWVFDGDRDFSLCYHAPTGSMTHPPFSPRRYGFSFSDKATGS